MLKISNKLGLFALVCTLAGLAGCGGGSGTDNKKQDLLVCRGDTVVSADGKSCGPVPKVDECPEGTIRNDKGVCVESNFKKPTLPDLSVFGADQDKMAVIYLNSSDKKFSGYNLHLWNNGACGAAWENPTLADAAGGTYPVPTVWPAGPGIKSTGATGAFPEDPIYGAYFIVKALPDAKCGNFIVKSAGAASKTKDLTITLKSSPAGLFDRMYFVILNGSDLQNADTNSLPICINDVCEAYEAPKLAISGVAAHWIDKTTLVWDRDVTEVKLYKAEAGKKMSANEDGTVANGVLVADLTSTLLSDNQKASVPHLSTLKAYAINLATDEIKSLLKQELLVVGKESDGHLFGTRLQNARLLDQLYTSGATDADEQILGTVYSGDEVSVSVWAPTATKVELRVFGETPLVADATLPVVDTILMELKNDTGIWSYTGSKAKLDKKFYRFRVTGYNQIANQTLTLEVPDPYAVSLSSDGLHAQFVDLNSVTTKPDQWDTHVVPAGTKPTAMSLYEVHVRDFSILDKSTTEANRGKYLGFTEAASAPVNHLKELVAAGLTHVHLLPVNDGSTVKETFSSQINLDSRVFELCVATNNAAPICGIDRPNNLDTLRTVLQSYEGDTDKARLLVAALKDLDGFNWNYDPQFFNVPEGSYATDSNGVTRIIEMRKMNQALHGLGLRVVMDVVYPHMKESGLGAAASTFDKIVPGYYFRVNAVTGSVENGTGAGSDTATEHAMMGKFLIDSVVHWATQYKVDGFRFDQSGFIPKAVLTAAYDKVKALDPDTYFYAEAWNPSGGSSELRVGITKLSTQAALADTAIGTFNDRMREELHDLNLVNGGTLDKVRAGLAANLSDFKLLTKAGALVKAGDLSRGAYNTDPQQAINYVDSHDNLTLWDWMQQPGALPADTVLADRVRIQNLILSVPTLSQGVPFFLMGSEMLRSKSLSPNSYDAGDWFNFTDFTMQSNNWRVGLPPEQNLTLEETQAALNDPEAAATPLLIEKSSDVFSEFLKISSSSKLFSLETAADVLARVGFHDGGVTQVSNVIVMSIDDGTGLTDLDPNYDAIVVVFNGTNAAITREISTATDFTLHPVQLASVDSVVSTASFALGVGDDAGKGLFTVPAYTTAVFVKQQSGTQAAGLKANVTSEAVAPIPYGTTKIYLPGTLLTPNWAFTGNELVYTANGIYVAEINIAGSTTPYAFKVASDDWSTVDRGTLKTAPEVLLNTPKTFAPGGSTVDNASILITETGKYRFSLDATDPGAPILTVSDALDVYKGTPVYLKGTVTSWDPEPENILTYAGNGIYTLTLPNLAAGAKVFKLASADWTVPNLGTATAITFGAPLAVTQGSNDNIPITLPTPGSYTFKLDVTNPAAPTVTVTAN